ncbi:universal stress protein [Pendulispora brunnea]|uniref:Universal stress protein n=1 Tax=Pendulispora brunnea TaxID=2905690 RepID=A0ABZ2JZ17_9BACT
MNPVRHILLATDFSPASERALASAIELAERFDAKLTLVHVLEPAPYPHAIGLPMPLPVEAFNGRRQGAIHHLESTVQEVRKRVPNAHALFCDGTAWRTIVAAAKEVHADIIVVGSHGRRGIPHRLLGSVAERVVRLSPVPVLTVHGFWFEDRVQAGRELAAALESLRAQSPAVVAISPGGIVVGTEVARILGASFDVLLTDRLTSEGFTLGAACEGGLTHFAPGAVQKAVAAENRDHLLTDTREKLEHDATKIRGTASLGDLWRRTVVVVSDAFLDPWRPLVAADALAKLGPDRLVFAAPVASDEALAELKTRFPDAVVLHRLHAHADASAAYRDFSAPSAHRLTQCIRATEVVAA